MAIGQAPITRIYQNNDGTFDYTNPEVSFIHQLLMEVNSDVQNEGWVFNREEHYPLLPNSDGRIEIPSNALRMDVSENSVYRTTDLVKRGDYLYDKLNHTHT